MGGFCSCFHVPVEEQNAVSDGSTSDTCYCPPCLIQNFKNKHMNQYMQRQGNESTPTNYHQASSSSSGLAMNNAGAASRPHVGAVEIISFSQQNGERGRQEQESGARPSRVQPEPVGQSDVRVNTKPKQELRIVVSPNKVEPQEQISKSPAVVFSSGVEHLFPSPDEVEECPTCLEEYTTENPKITGKCTHHYHLSCIYEWMERSANCPVCAKLMLFDE